MDKTPILHAGSVATIVFLRPAFGNHSGPLPLPATTRRGGIEMIQQMTKLERVARVAMGDTPEEDPLPPGPNYGPFGYFRLALLIFAAVIVALLIFTFW